MSKRLDYRFRKQRHIAALSDHFFVCGAGRVGSAICECFAGSGLVFVAVKRGYGPTQIRPESGELFAVGDVVAMDGALEALAQVRTPAATA